MLAAATQAATAACDHRDGVTDGIVGDWKGCRFDARTLIGTVTPCGVVTAADADLIDKMWAGPRDADGGFRWYGLERDADLRALNNSSGGTGVPFFVGLDRFRYFLLQNPDWDWQSMTYEQYLLLFQQSVLQYQAVIATDDPDLSRFRLPVPPHGPVFRARRYYRGQELHLRWRLTVVPSRRLSTCRTWSATRSVACLAFSGSPHTGRCSATVRPRGRPCSMIGGALWRRRAPNPPRRLRVAPRRRRRGVCQPLMCRGNAPKVWSCQRAREASSG
jgi:hypothetical protein